MAAKSSIEIIQDEGGAAIRKVRLLRPAQLRKDFCRLIEDFSYSRHTWDVFSDFVEFAALATHQLPYLSGDLKACTASEEIEAAFQERAQRLPGKEKDIEKFSAMLGIMTMALAQEPHDFLGACFEDLGIANARAGQFFTPPSVCRFMATISAGNIKAQLDAKLAKKQLPILTIQDPACGAGGMLIAFAAEVLSQGIDIRQNLLFDAIDIDRRCFNMTYAQLGLLSLMADCHWGNTIKWEFWHHRPTPQRALFNDWAAPALRANAMLRLIREIEALEGGQVTKADFANKRKIGKWEAISDSIEDAAEAVQAHTDAGESGKARADLPPVQLSILDNLDFDSEAG